MKYAEIIVFKKVGNFDAPLTYHIPENLRSVIAVGTLVCIPFRNAQMNGLVVGLKKELDDSFDEKKIKCIRKLETAFSFPDHTIVLAKSIQNYYKTTLSRALKLMMPSLVWKGENREPMREVYRLRSPDANLRGVKQKEIRNILNQAPECTMLSQELKKRIPNFTRVTLRGLAKKKIIEIKKESLYQPCDTSIFPIKPFEKTLTVQQKKVLTTIKESSRPVLLHGVTGSGKTEIYLRLIMEAIKKGKQAVLLVPEIALTPQIVQYFKVYLGDHIALFHSGLSDHQRMTQWWRVKNGTAPLVIGSRSAVFAPVSDLGILIIDEEHEWTYKQESNPYYETHVVAQWIAKQAGAILVLGSATPRLESYQKAQEGEYALLSMPQRINQSTLPQITVVDLREEFKKKNFSIFSYILQQKIQERLDKKEQIILFVNQRGVARAVVCRDCGHTEQCHQCEISLKVHRAQQRSSKLICHYCGFIKDSVLLCSECQSPHIRHVGVGTQRVEEEMNRLFPEARIVRADRDTTKNREGFKDIYHDFLNHKYDVLVGTQMVAKGLDFANVSLIGIVLADVGMHIPDFRSHERLFQIITQVAGRCGRADKKGEVILQTYNPEHFTIQQAASYNYRKFAEKELEFRKKLGYPPFNRLIKFTVVGTDEAHLQKHVEAETQTLEDIFALNKLPVKVVSSPAMIPKVANRYYYHVLLRSENPKMVFDHWKTPKHWRVDIDPIHTA
jgi:primosomal protein N' (replication factor Y) (superfamily II helicase)